MLRILGFVQGIYYAITGLWPIFNITGFLRVTGPKTDLWLVKLIGGLTVSISVLFFFAGVRSKISREALAVILISSMSYLLTDIINYAEGSISVVYLVDAIFQVLFITGWIYIAIKSGR